MKTSNHDPSFEQGLEVIQDIAKIFSTAVKQGHVDKKPEGLYNLFMGLFTTYEMEVDYGKSYEQVLKRGNYDNYSDTKIRELLEEENFLQGFPIPSDKKKEKVKEKVLAKLVILPKTLDAKGLREKLEAYMNLEGYSSSNLMELFTFGYLYPEVQRLFDIFSFNARRYFTTGYFTLFLCGSTNLDFRHLTGGISHRREDRGIFESGDAFLFTRKYLEIPAKEYSPRF